MKHARIPQGPSFAKKLTVFFAVSLIWLVLDRATKWWANTGEVGDIIVEDIAGFFEFRLVHNTGAAWGIFADATFFLGIFSFAVCAIILVVFFSYYRRHGSMAEVAFLALIFAGGIGNGIDRLVYSYVIDFINTKFIQFPVFNVADIGVTGGIILFLLAFLLSERKNKKVPFGALS